MKVVIVGSGNVATVLGKVIHNAGHQIVQVLSRNENHAKELAQIFKCSSGSFKSTEYKEADIYFENNIQQLDKALPIEKTAREAALKKELLTLEKVILKLGEEYITAIHQSMKSFKEHVSQAHHNVLVDFIFPMPIKGLTY